MSDTPTLGSLLASTQDETTKRLILDAYKLGVADGYGSYKLRPNYPSRYIYVPYGDGSIPILANQPVSWEDDGA